MAHSTTVPTQGRPHTGTVVPTTVPVQGQQKVTNEKMVLNVLFDAHFIFWLD